MHYMLLCNIRDASLVCVCIQFDTFPLQCSHTMCTMQCMQLHMQSMNLHIFLVFIYDFFVFFLLLYVIYELPSRQNNDCNVFLHNDTTFICYANIVQFVIIHNIYYVTIWRRCPRAVNFFLPYNVINNLVCNNNINNNYNRHCCALIMINTKQLIKDVSFIYFI